jgi:hypothetical protein
MVDGLFTAVVLFCGAQVPIGIGEQGPPFAMMVQFELMDACGYILGLFPAHVIVVGLSYDKVHLPLPQSSKL